MTRSLHDVLIVGGGPVGLALACLLRDDFSATNGIAIVEQGDWSESQPSGDLGIRVSALSPSSCTVLERAGAWSNIDQTRVCAIERMVVWEGVGGPDRERQLEFDAASLGAPALGYIAENDALVSALRKSLKESAGITVYAGEKPAELSFSADTVTLAFAGGASVGARLVVGADGASSWLRKTLGVGLREHDYQQFAIVGHVSSDVGHAGTAWQRFLPGGPIALLPLPDGRSSFVWSCPSEFATELLALDTAGFEKALNKASSGVLGKLALASERAGFPLRRRHAVRYTGRRWALAGDAAHRVHPLAGQGLNLGLLDCTALADTLRHGARRHFADPGDPAVLRRYERSRKGDTVAMLAVTDILNRLFAVDWAGSRAAGSGFGLVNRLGPVKRVLARHAMGIAGLPAATDHRQ